MAAEARKKRAISEIGEARRKLECPFPLTAAGIVSPAGKWSIARVR